MEFKKCERCGCFFSSNNCICHNCLNKERSEINKFKNYIEENSIENINSLSELSLQTGISGKNLNRFLGYEDFSNINEQLNLK